MADKVCGFDVDGVLNYYPDPWVRFLSDRLNRKFNTLNEAKNEIPYAVYKALKYDYRECGIKTTLKVRAGAKEVLDALKADEYDIIILTSRPFRTHRSLFKQTTDWLDKNGLVYDGLISGADKYARILTEVPSLKFMVEDHRAYANHIASFGFTVFLMDSKYNQGDIGETVIRVHELEEVLDYV